MAKGVPVTGDRFTERSPNGVMGKPYDFTAFPKTEAGVTAGQILIPILARRRRGR